MQNVCLHIKCCKKFKHFWPLFLKKKIGGGGWGEDNYVPGKIEALQVVGNNWCKEWFHPYRKDGSVQSHVAWHRPLHQVVPQHYLIFAIVANFLSRWNDICKKKYIYIYTFITVLVVVQSHTFMLLFYALLLDENGSKSQGKLHSA